MRYARKNVQNISLAGRAIHQEAESTIEQNISQQPSVGISGEQQEAGPVHHPEAPIGEQTEDEIILTNGRVEGDHENNARFDYLTITKNENQDNVQSAIDRILTGHETVSNVLYLRTFLNLAGMVNIPTGIETMKNRIRDWCNASPDRRPYELKSKDQLRAIYLEKHDKQATMSWNKSTLIEKIIEYNSSAQGGDTSYRDCKQKLLDEIISYSFGMRPLTGKARDACALGHHGEEAISRLIMQCSEQGNFPFGTIEEIFKVGLVRSNHLETCQDSIDRLFAIRNDDGTRELFLAEIKTRISVERIGVEFRRINKLGQNPDKTYYTTVQSDSADIHFHIPYNSERMQLLHHCYTYGKKEIFHIVGTTNSIISCTKVIFQEDILESYGKILEAIHDDVLKCFFSHDIDAGFDHFTNEEHLRLQRAIKVNKKAIPDLDSFRC